MMNLQIRNALLASTIFFVVPPAFAQIIVSDVALFYRVFDAAHGQPTVTEIQKDYLDAGSKGLHEFVPERIVSAQNLVNVITRRPKSFINAKECIPALSAIEKHAPSLISQLKEIYPNAIAPSVTIVVGAANSGGTASPEVGVILSLEVTCENRTHSSLPLEQRFIDILAHEIVHTQQHNEWNNTVLSVSLTEGIADFLGELMSGHNANEHLKLWTKGKEAEIKKRFYADMDKSDLSQWLYTGLGTPDHPGDLGYWVGYQIAKSIYIQTPDKSAAVSRLLEEHDPKSLLRESGW